MLLTVTTTRRPATDLGFLLHKNPARAQTFELAFGRAHVFYPEATDERCTAALAVEVDPVALVRQRRGPSGEGGALEQYVNDRPYAPSSFLSVALSRIFASALGGRSKDKPELVTESWPLELKLFALPCRAGETFLRGVFEPLGYEVEATRLALDDTNPDWGASRYFDVTLRTTARVADVLTQLYVLVPVLDDDKHYWVGDDEVEKLVRHGEGWLATHPQRDAITHRYLRHQAGLTRAALQQLADEDDPEPEERLDRQAAEEAALEKPARLNDRRLEAVEAALAKTGATRVVDLGCGEGKLLRQLLKNRQFREIVGMDVSVRSLEIAKEKLHVERASEHERERLKLMHGSLVYRDERLQGFDAAAVVEVVEHLDPLRLKAFERVLFEFARPKHVVVTTPNAEYNALFPNLAKGAFRHRDHRFEWTRAEFAAWAKSVSERHGYSYELEGIGAADAALGTPTQMAVFSR